MRRMQFSVKQSRTRFANATKLDRKSEGELLSYQTLRPSETPAASRRCCALAVMAKAPRPGKVKTRLSPPLSPQQASALNICFIKDTAENIHQVTQATPSDGVVAYTPVGDEAAF